VIDQLAWEETEEVPTGGCGICGPDDRVLSDEDWAARLLPAGCSSSVFNTDSCFVSAGHCMSGGMVAQFNVPLSSANCNIVNPPVADQFPMVTFQGVNGGVGNDWGVMVSGTNNLGQKPFERYGLFRPIASSPPVSGQPLNIWGYGVDEQCTFSQVQQTSGGTVTGVSSTFFNHNVDATFGNSGSGVIRNDEILGIATHCPCPNFATRVDHPTFAAAREALCPSSPAVSAPLGSMQVITGNLIGGSLAQLQSADNAYVAVTSVTQGVRNNTLVQVNAQSPFSVVSELNFTVEVGPANATPVFLSLFLFNFDTGIYESLDFDVVSTTSNTAKVFEAVTDPNKYVSGSGEVRVRVAETARQPQTPAGYTQLIDFVGITVRP
jgi:hypothetical protein